MICHSKGIPRLQEAILDAAVQATDPHTKEKVIGMMVCMFSLHPLLNDKHFNFSSFYHWVHIRCVMLVIFCLQVPSSYVSLQQAVLNECERLRKEDQPPVLSEEEFATLAKSDPKSDIHDAEELQLGMKLLPYMFKYIPPNEV